MTEAVSEATKEPEVYVHPFHKPFYANQPLEKDADGFAQTRNEGRPAPLAGMGAATGIVWQPFVIQRDVDGREFIVDGGVKEYVDRETWRYDLWRENPETWVAKFLRPTPVQPTNAQSDEKDKPPGTAGVVTRSITSHVVNPVNARL